MTDRFRIFAGRAADATGASSRLVLTVADGIIVDVADTGAATPAPNDIDARDGTVVPGFVDVHIHGGAGRSLMEGTVDAVRAVARHLARHGVTSLLSTTVTAPRNETAEAVAAASMAMQDHAPGDGAVVRGVHLEGPYISAQKPGAQPVQYIRPPSAAELEEWCGGDLAAVRIITIAPEVPGALDLIRHVTGRGIIASLGHSNANWEEVDAAIAAGARHVTHWCNAMSGMAGRAPGLLGATLARSELTAELIWDGIHVHRGSIAALLAARGSGGVMLVSDGIPGAGMADGFRFSLGGEEAVVRDGAARLPDGTLAGSVLTLDRAFANAGGLPLEARAAITSATAARSLGLGESAGSLAVGAAADIAVLAPDGSVSATVVRGHVEYRA